MPLLADELYDCVTRAFAGIASKVGGTIILAGERDLCFVSPQIVLWLPVDPIDGLYLSYVHRDRKGILVGY